MPTDIQNKTQEEKDLFWMQAALDEAKLAADEGEVPIGAVVVVADKIVSCAHNRREHDNNPAAHAEFLAIEAAAHKLSRWRLCGAQVYVTLEPCLMCAGLMVNARIDRCVFGAHDPKGGALGTLYQLNEDTRLNHRFEVVGGVCKEECAQILRDFFKARRRL